MREFIDKVINSKLVRKLAGFSITGVIASLISIVLLFLFNEILHFNSYVSYVLSYFLSIVFSYLSNSLAVWKSDLKLSVFLKYIIVYCSSMALGAFLLYLLKVLFPAGNDTVLSLCTMPVTLTWNYLFVNKLLSHNNE